MDIRKFFGGGKPAAGGAKKAAAPAKSTAGGGADKRKASPPAKTGAKKAKKGSSPKPASNSSQGTSGADALSDAASAAAASDATTSRFFGGADKKVKKEPNAAAKAKASPKKSVPYTDEDREADKDVEWKWQFHTQMKKFDAPTIEKLNTGWKAYTKGRGGNSKMDVAIDQGGSNVEYTINFEKMEQVNKETGHPRRIARKVPVPVKVEPPKEPSPKPKVKAEPKAAAAAGKGSAAAAAPKKSGGNPAWRGGGGGAPPMQGLKHINKGAPNCLSGKCFLITGTLESMERDDCEDLIKKYGGTISKSVPKKKALHYALVGTDAGPSKLLKLEEKGTPQIDEDGLLTLLRDSLPPDEKAKEPPVGTMKEADLGEPIAQASVMGAAAASDASAAAARSAAVSAADVESGPPPAKIVYDEAHSLWTEKYKPKSQKDLVGNFQLVKKVNEWLKVWNSSSGPPRERAVLMAGPPGHGKTSMAHVMLNEAGYEVMEFNASDVRSKKAVGNQIEDITNSRSMSEFFAAGDKQVKKVAVIMDEVDGMSSGDRGGVQELIRIIVKSNVPIICCCNDETAEKVRALKKYCVPMVFAKPLFAQVKERIRMICKAEGMNVNDEGIEKLYLGCNGDLRSMITSLQMWSNDDSVTSKSGSLNGAAIGEALKTTRKEVLNKNIYDVVKEVFEGRSAEKPNGPSLSDRLDSFFMDIDMAPMWTQQIYPTVVNSIQCAGKTQQARAIWYMSRCADSISDSDLVQQQIRGSQNWSLLPLFGHTSTAKVGSLLGNVKGAPIAPAFPMLLGQISKGNKRARILRELAMHTSGSFSGGAQGIRMDYFGPLRERLVNPLKERGAAAVPEVIQMLDDFHMSKDDWDTLCAEFGFKGLSAEYDKQIDGKVRAALTRQYNKSHCEVSKVKASAAEKDTTAGSDHEDDDDDDGLVKKKKGKAPPAKRKSGGKAGGAAKKKKK